MTVTSSETQSLGVGVVGGGYMGKRHAVALHAVGALCDTRLRPVAQMICTTTEAGAAAKARQLGFHSSTADWRILVENPLVEAVVIASPQVSHRDIATAALALGKPVLCEKPLGASLQDALAMTRAAKQTGVMNMVGFNYIRTPVTQYARQLIQSGELGDILFFRGEHCEDFCADPATPFSWRNQGKANGTMGDLAPHMINLSQYLLGDIEQLCASIDQVFAQRPDPDDSAKNIVCDNDDQAQLMCKFARGCSGHLLFSRVASGRKMGLTYEVVGTLGSIRFDQEDQNALWLYKVGDAVAQQGFRKILSNAEHPDYGLFCEGPGHGTGYQDQLILEMRDFLQAIETGTTCWPQFSDGLSVSEVIDAAWQSDASRSWVEVKRCELS